MSNKLLLFISLFISSFTAIGQQTEGEYYQIRIYQFDTWEQYASTDAYMRKAYVPALHRNGFSRIGVFHPILTDTSGVKKLYVFIPSPTLERFATLPDQLLKDTAYLRDAKEYLNAPFDKPTYSRIETILLKSFRLAPFMNIPMWETDKDTRVFELRSYESATEKLYASKVKMFNEGGEINLFKRLNFFAVFYADVISGSRMPNLMYMTAYQNKQDRDAHWETFKNDPEWKRLSGLEEYQHTVSKAEIILMNAAIYSDF